MGWDEYQDLFAEDDGFDESLPEEEEVIEEDDYAYYRRVFYGL